MVRGISAVFAVIAVAVVLLLHPNFWQLCALGAMAVMFLLLALKPRRSSTHTDFAGIVAFFDDEMKGNTLPRRNLKVVGDHTKARGAK